MIKVGFVFCFCFDIMFHVWASASVSDGMEVIILKVDIIKNLGCFFPVTKGVYIGMCNGEGVNIIRIL